MYIYTVNRVTLPGQNQVSELLNLRMSQTFGLISPNSVETTCWNSPFLTVDSFLLSPLRRTHALSVDVIRASRVLVVNTEGTCRLVHTVLQPSVSMPLLYVREMSAWKPHGVRTCARVGATTQNKPRKIIQCIFDCRKRVNE